MTFGFYLLICLILYNLKIFLQDMTWEYSLWMNKFDSHTWIEEENSRVEVNLLQQQQQKTTKQIRKALHSMTCPFGHWVSNEVGMQSLHFCHGVPNIPRRQTHSVENCMQNGHTLRLSTKTSTHSIKTVCKLWNENNGWKTFRVLRKKPMTLALFLYNACKERKMDRKRYFYIALMFLCQNEMSYIKCVCVISERLLLNNPSEKWVGNVPNSYFGESLCATSLLVSFIRNM